MCDVYVFFDTEVGCTTRYSMQATEKIVLYTHINIFKDTRVNLDSIPCPTAQYGCLWWNSSTISAPRGAAPLTTLFNDDKSALAAIGCLFKNMTMGGTAKVIFICKKQQEHEHNYIQSEARKENDRGSLPETHQPQTFLYIAGIIFWPSDVTIFITRLQWTTHMHAAMANTALYACVEKVKKIKYSMIIQNENVNITFVLSCGGSSSQQYKF